MKRIGFVLALVIAALGLGACGSEGPETKAARELATKLDDVRQARDIVDSSVARSVNCARAARHAFSRQTGEPQVWVYRRDDDTLECFDTAGHHPMMRSALQRITSDEVSEILADPRYNPPAPAPRPPVVAPPPAAAPTPLPELSEGPCCLSR